RLTRQPNSLDDHPYDPSMAEAICCGLPEGCGAEPEEPCALGAGAGVAAAAARCARRSAARLAARWAAARLAAARLAPARSARLPGARRARPRLPPSLATSWRAAPVGCIPAWGWEVAVLAPAIARLGDELPADAPEAVKPAAIAAGAITAAPAIATVILDNFR